MEIILSLLCVLVHIPLEGFVIARAVIGQPDGVFARKAAMRQLVGKPVGAGVYARKIPGLFQCVAERLAHGGQHGFA